MANSPSTESFYIKQLIAGEESAYRYFIRTYEDMAFTLAVSIVKDDFVAEEVAQDAFIKAFNGIASFSQQSAFKTWFYRIIVNEAFMRLKKEKKQQLVYCEDYEMDIADTDSLNNLQESERFEMINFAFKLMPPNEAIALRLFYLEESSIKDICIITGYTEANIKVLLHRGRKRMQSIIEQQKKQKA
ncbi:RNA polymerase sigma factor [Mucilaginibacter terrae]|uniref:RNA polymerase sigma factor n=1 Tax=Mucilaginibacter terrae TaxID=1955052 RepID=A0ABU3GX45_9SPHI|nr:RNA polymerase sigma factor [Mucilaginibacter terrae]MDT3404230.1 RNA polymerase sigma factor (sigma-70 family) [Mucilaginibacter terrae]